MKLFYDETENTTDIPMDACPYCGSKATLLINCDYWKPTYCVSCTNSDGPFGHWRCRGVKHPDSFDPEDPAVAIKLWNMRHWEVPQTSTFMDCYGNWHDITGKPIEDNETNQPNENTCKDITY